MGNKNFRSRLVGGFGGAGGTLVGSPILQILLGYELSLWLLAMFESLGALFIIIAVILYLTEK